MINPYAQTLMIATRLEIRPSAAPAKSVPLREQLRRLVAKTSPALAK